MSAFLPMPLTDEAGEFQYDRIDRPDQASTSIVLLDVAYKWIARLVSELMLLEHLCWHQVTRSQADRKRLWRAMLRPVMACR